MILRVEHGSFAYPKGPEVLRDVELELHEGEILSVLGPNGAGKTTLLRCMTGMLRWGAGRCLLDGEDIREIPPRRLWRKMAYVPQARSATPAYTVFQTVLLGRSSRIGSFAAPKKEDYLAAEQALEKLGISALADKRCTALSGGELQMVLIARAMASEPEILIFDEPESNLDFKNQLIVLDTMTGLAQNGMACIFNTHYPAHALQRSHKALLLKKGGESVFGCSPDIVTEGQIRSAFGVNAVVSAIETGSAELPNVVPLSISDEAGAPERADRQTLASTTVILADNRASDRINALLHEYRGLLIGRMGMPDRRSGAYIIHINLYGSQSEIRALTHRLGLLPGISVKTTFARETPGGKEPES